MFSSAKFLSPIVTAGLPTPGPLDAAGVPVALVVAAGVLAVVLDVLDELLPHAVNTTAQIANIATGTTFHQVLPRIRCLLFICLSTGIIGKALGAARRAPAAPASTRAGSPAAARPRAPRRRAAPAPPRRSRRPARPRSGSSFRLRSRRRGCR